MLIIWRDVALVVDFDAAFNSSFNDRDQAVFECKAEDWMPKLNAQCTRVMMVMQMISPLNSTRQQMQQQLRQTTVQSQTTVQVYQICGLSDSRCKNLHS